MKIDFKKVYEDRIIEIDKQIKIAIYRKQWDIKKNLESQKRALLEVIGEMEE